MFASCRLARFFGNSPSFWLDLQMHWDLFQAHNSEQAVLSSIQAYQPPSPGASPQVAEPAPPEYKAERAADASKK